MKFLKLFLVVLFMVSSAIGSSGINPIDAKLVKKPADRIYYPGDPIRTTRSVEPAPLPEEPFRDIGERTLVGDTWYDYQSNGNIGKMISVDEFGRIHLCWMDGRTNDLANGQRDMKYNCFPNRLGEEVWGFEDGTTIQSGSRGGYGSMWITNDVEARALAFCHSTIEGDVVGLCAKDYGPGWGAFQCTAMPRYPEFEAIWPQGVLSPENRIHVVTNRRDAGYISYIGGNLVNNETPQFGELAIQVGETHLNTFNIGRSPHSERVAITYMRSRVDNMEIHNFADWDGFLAYQMNNDLMLVWSDDGVNWNFDDQVNITNNIQPDPRQEGNLSEYGDTLRAYASQAIIFDAEDNIHVVFDARLLKVQAIPHLPNPPIDALTLDYSFLFHWSEETEEIDAVADGWFSQSIYDENGDFANRPTPGAWRSNVCNPSLAYDENGDLYCVFNYYPYNDYSIHGRCNGDVAVTVSEDNGQTWTVPTMITETNSLGAEEGHHTCESYPTVAERVTDGLHITYEMDTEPGTTIQAGDEGPASLCQWYYHYVPLEEIDRGEILEDTPEFHIQFRPAIMNVTRQYGAPEPDMEVGITTEVEATGDHELTTVQLEYQIVGVAGTNAIDMDANVHSFTAAIPAQEEGVNVWYRIRATDNTGQVTLRPEGYWYSYMVRSVGDLTIHDVQYPGPKEWGVDYSPYKDYVVTVRGVVTTPREFYEQYDGFAIQMETDAYWSGVFVRGANPDVDPGTYVQVTGIVRERDENNASKWAYLTYIEIVDVEDDVIIIEDRELPEPVYISQLQAITSFSEHAEDLEGMLVRLSDVYIGREALVDSVFRDVYIPILQADDDDEDYVSYINLYGLTDGQIESIDLDSPEEGQRIEFLTGVLTENEAYSVAPLDITARDPFSVSEDADPLPNDLTLAPVYPNPFNAETRVLFSMTRNTTANINIFDLTGRKVMALHSGAMNAGEHTMVVDASALSTGVYILRLDTPEASLSQKIVLVK